MIIAEPRLTESDQAVLALIREQRNRLHAWIQSTPKRWMGSLRRNTFARAIQGSNTIEGYNATLDEAVAAVENEPPVDERSETWLALSGYRAAMTYILQTCDDQYFEFSRQFLKSLHFMMTGFDLGAFPGRWRPGAVYVVDRATGETVYDAPPAEMIDPLVGTLIAYLREPPRQSPLVSAAMAHLNLTMIHPFKDGNGRMARALQTLVLAREGHSHPVFSSIEEWLGRRTTDYYAVLSEIGQGEWRPDADASPWIRFCLRAHYQQAAIVIHRFDEYDDLFGAIDGIVDREGLNSRTALPLFDCALGLRMTNSRYQKEAQVTQHVANRELRALTEIGLVEPFGEKRGRYYLAGPELRNARARVRRDRRPVDPYGLVGQPRLPGF